MPNSITNVIEVLFPTNALVTEQQLETSSQVGGNQVYRLCGSTGMFYRPGVIASDILENKLLPTVSSGGGTVDILVSPGKAVTASGYVIEVTATVSNSYTTAQAATIVSTTPYLFVKYTTQVTPTITSVSAISGTTVNVSVENTQDSFSTMFYWSASSTLPTSGDAIIIGKLTAGITFDYSFSNRNIALLNVLFTNEQTNPSGSISCSVDSMHSVYEFLACRGRTARSITNPFGLTEVDIYNLGDLITSMLETPGIPAQSFTATNGDFLEPIEDPTDSTKLTVKAGTFVDSTGRFVDVTSDTNLAIPNDNTWYYVYAVAVDAADGSGDHLLKSYSVGYQSASPVAPKFIVAQVRHHTSGGDDVWEIADLRTLLSCRSVAGIAPDAPYSLVLTTGSNWDAISNLGYASSLNTNVSHNQYENTWVEAVWTHPLTGDVSYFGVKAVPMTIDGVEVPEQAIDAQSYPIQPVSGGQEWTPRLQYVFNNMIPGIRYMIYAWAVGHPPGSPKSSTISGSIVAGQGTQLDAPSNFTYNEVYSGHTEVDSTGATFNSYEQFTGLMIAWGAPSGVAPSTVLEYELYASPAAVTPPYTPGVPIYRGTGTQFFMAAKNGDTWNLSCCAVDNGGFRGLYATASDTSCGDTIPPYWPSGSNLALTTGLESSYLPVTSGEDYARVGVETDAWIKAIWNDAVDAKSGVAYYEIAHGPIYTAPFTSPNIDDIHLNTGLYPYPGSQGVPIASIHWGEFHVGCLYGVRIRAVDKCGNKSAWSSWVTITAGGTPVDPPSITSFTAQGINGGNMLSWSVGSDVSAFEIFGAMSRTPSIPEDRIAVVDGSQRQYFHSVPSLVSTADVSGNVQSGYVSGATWTYIVRGVDASTGYCGTASSPKDSTPVILDAISVALFANEVVASRAGYPTLDARLAAPTALSSQETVDARQGFSSLADNLSALSRNGVNWGNIRIVAVKGGQFNSINAAIASVPNNTTDAYTILVFPGEYTEEVGWTAKYISLIGIGRVVIYGVVSPVAFLGTALVENITIVPTGGGSAYGMIVGAGDYSSGKSIFKLQNVDIYNPVGNALAILIEGVPYVVIRNCRINKGAISIGTQVKHTLIDNCRIIGNVGECILVNTTPVSGDVVVRNCYLYGSTYSISVMTGQVHASGNVWDNSPSGSLDFGTVVNTNNVNQTAIAPFLEYNLD